MIVTVVTAHAQSPGNATGQQNVPGPDATKSSAIPDPNAKAPANAHVGAPTFPHQIRGRLPDAANSPNVTPGVDPTTDEQMHTGGTPKPVPDH
jgi:hypothetical protein